MPAQDDTLLELIGEIQGMLDLEELVHGLMDVLLRLVPSDWAAFNDVGPDQRGAIAVSIPEAPRELHEIWAEHWQENPLAAHTVATQDGRPYRFSDFITQEQLHATALYQRLYAQMGVEYQIAFTLPGSPGRVLAIALSRGDRDYSDAERDLLLRARPYMIQAWRNAIQHTTLRDELLRRPFADGHLDPALAAALAERGLTARQAEVVWLVARGSSNADAAAVLGLSERTVQKHVERSYKALGVGARSEAAGLVWSLAPPPQPSDAPRRVRLEELPPRDEQAPA